MTTIKNILFGNYLSSEIAPHTCAKPMLSFYSPGGQHFDISASQLSKHILLIGAIGTGKTNTFNFIIDDLDKQMSSSGGSDVMLIFDTKGDFKKEFYDKNTDILIGNSSEFRSITSYWNVFREIEHGGIYRKEKELMAKEIAKQLFEDRKNTSQPFFSNAACDIFSKVLIGTMRQFWEQPLYKKLEQDLLNHRPDSPEGKKIIQTQHEIFNQSAHYYNNQMLVNDILLPYTVDDYIRLLNRWPDFKGAINYIGNGQSVQALGVLGELNSMITDYFIGVFADYEEGKDISIRELIHNKGGRKIFIEYDLSIGEVLTPVYKLLVDLGLKEALGRTHSQGNVFLVVDEFKLLPKLSHIDDALNFGRSLGIKTIVGIQNIKQLEDIYGETRGQVIAAGFSNVISFRMTDEPSRKYISDLYGKNLLTLEYTGSDGLTKYHEREGFTVEDWQLMGLDIGEAVVGLSGYPPFYFQFEEWQS